MNAVEPNARLAAATPLLDRLLHDLKQPLNMIRVVAQDLMLDVKKDRFELGSLPPSMEEIMKAVDLAVRRIDLIRVFSKPQSSGPSPQTRDPSTACLRATARILKEHPSIEMSESIEPDLPAVATDLFHLEQAVWELADNAVRASEAAGRSNPRIEVSATRCANGMRVTVGDNGAGVDGQLGDTLFEPFVSTRQDAAGLGLALVRVIVLNAGGEVRLAASSEAGSLFEIILPGEG